MLLSDGGTLDPEHLFAQAVEPEVAPSGAGGLPFPAPLHAIEEAAVRAMVERCGGNRSAAARRLGISRSKILRVLARPEKKRKKKPGRGGAA